MLKKLIDIEINNTELINKAKISKSSLYKTKKREMLLPIYY